MRGGIFVEETARALVASALHDGVSDIHLLPRKEKYLVFFRINGRLVEKSSEPIQWGNQLISYFKFLADMDVGEKRQPQSGSASIEVDQKMVELRFSTITNYQMRESLVIRILRQENHTSTSINNIFPKDVALLKNLMLRKSGLVLFSGPVGSGKTTTIYQLLRERMKDQAVQVITMEDPVEIFEPDFLQVQVNERADITYDLLIKASLRHHPDILMIGEIRDEETARMVIRGALTGHLMVATLHAKNTEGVIARLQELQISQEQLKQTLIGVISQRLVPRYCYLCGGVCHSSCQNLSKSHKRSIIFEILSGPALKEMLMGESYQIISLNKKLRKAWAFGYIDSRTFAQYELV